MTFFRIGWILIAIALTPSVAIPGLPVTQVRFATFDADTADALVAEITIDGKKVDGGRYILPSDADSRVAIEVHADAGSKYYSRSLTIYLEGLTNSKPVYNIYLASVHPGTARC